MFSSNTKLIIYFSRSVINAYIFDGSKGEKNIGEYQRSESNLEEILKTIMKVSKMNEARVLLSEDLGYLYELDIPLDTKEERKFVEEQIIGVIPEDLKNSDWDFVEIGKDKNSKKVRVFAPVKAIWQNLSQTAQKVGLKIEAVETVNLASKRNKDPIIGMGMKNDIQGKDEDVLNIVPTEEKEKEKEDKEDEKVVPLIKSKNKTIPIVVLVILFILLIIGGFYYYLKNIKNNSPSAVNQILVPTITEVQATPTPVFDLLTLKIQILNGSGVSGKAGIVKQYLESLEYGQIDTGNAESQNYKNINLSIKESKKMYQNRLIDDLSKKYKISEIITTLDNSNEYDAIIILGKE